MKKLAAVCAAFVAVLAFGAARASANGVIFGVNDNAGLYGNTQFWSLLRGENMSVDTIILRWNEETPDGFDGIDGQALPQAIAAAQAAGVQVELDVSPRHSAELSNLAGPTHFAAWLTKLAQTYPQVHSYIVMNECNQDLFVNPQYQNGQNISAAECGTWLAAGYDALKAVNPGIFVWGLGLSPRGNVPNGQPLPSTDPIDFLHDLGQWYRRSGRTKPLMDGLDLHPYPIPQSLPFAQGYGDPHDYSVANLSRAYAAFYEAFNGTPQPTVGPGHLPVQLNEVGIQTDTGGHGGYTGAENAATRAGGVLPPYDSEQYQAQWYAQLVDAAECDADITNVNVFKLIDETSLAGWQSGLYFADGAPKASAAAVRNEIAKDDGQCPTGAPRIWSPSATIAGGPVAKAASTTTRSTVVLTSVVGSFSKLLRGTPATMVVAGGTAGTAVLGTAAVPLTVTWSLSRSATHAARRAQSARQMPVVHTLHVAKGERVAIRFASRGLLSGTYRFVASVRPKAASSKLRALFSTVAFAVKAGKFA